MTNTDDNNIRKIVTSNTESNDDCNINYRSLINNREIIKDNSRLILMKLLKETGVTKIYLAGFDGYELDFHSNYVKEELELLNDRETIEKLNRSMKSMLDVYSKEINIEFLTESKYQRSQI